MHTFVFNLHTNAVFTLVPSERSPYGHSYGGPPQHKGTVITGTDINARLQYNLNLSDPNLGFDSAPSQWLPLYCGPNIFDYGFAYRVVSNSEIDILSVPDEDVADVEFQSKLTQFPVDLVRFPYDSTDPEDAYRFAGIFGLDQLAPNDKRTVAKRILEEYEEEIGQDCSDLPLDELLLLQGHDPFTQGAPREDCPNPKCKLHTAKPKAVYRSKSSLLLLLTPDENTDSEICEELAAPDSGQLTFQVCHDCFSVREYNTCT